MEGHRILTNEFLAKYEGYKPPFAVIGEFVYYRTYSRWLEELGRRECWIETCWRSVEYQFGLALKMGLPIEEVRPEAEEFFDNMAKLKQFPSGRTMWIGGTEVAEKFPLANYNCAGVIIDEFEAFVDIFYLLLVGAGAGFRVMDEDVEQLPKIRTDIEMLHAPYSKIAKADREDNTSIEFVDEICRIVVGDSKEGWVKALDFYLRLLWDSAYRKIKTVVFVYDNVRPKGERLKTFGGTASGHESLKNMFTKIGKIVNMVGEERGWYAKLQPIDCLDIANIIAENVVVGGVRRSSEMCVFTETNEDILSAKQRIYEQVDGEWVENKDLTHRTMSNNSIMYFQKPTRQKLHDQLQAIRHTGEPSFINGEQALKRNPYFRIVNPCGEVLMSNRGLCNLVTNNVVGFIENGLLNIPALLRAIRMAVRASLRITCVDLELPKWDTVQKKYRLLGVSLTGWQDAMDMIDYGMEEQASLLRLLRGTAHEEANSYAKKLGVNEPILVTTVKPEGTISLLPYVSCGIHDSANRFGIRRVRVSRADAMVSVAQELGWTIKPNNGEPDDIDLCSTVVLEFPVKSNAKRTKQEVGAIEQLDRYKMFMDNYVDHNASNTINVRAHEWDAVEQWMWDNWDSVIAVTFLELDNHVYPLAPEESITEEEYDRMVANMKPFDASLLSKYERLLDTEVELADTSLGCATGNCPIV